MRPGGISFSNFGILIKNSRLIEVNTTLHHTMETAGSSINFPRIAVIPKRSTAMCNSNQAVFSPDRIQCPKIERIHRDELTFGCEKNP
jgi:hypothetical protein